MKPIKMIIVEDSPEFSEALKKALLEQKTFPCEVVILNPVDKEAFPTPPSFEEFHNKIEEHAQKFRWIVLMDNHLGRWKWRGAHLAPSFDQLIMISTDRDIPARFKFTEKTQIAYSNSQGAKDKLIQVIQEVIKTYFPPGICAELGLS